MYQSIDDLPFVCQLNLPLAAQKLYREAFNRAWRAAAEQAGRYQTAQTHAWTEVRKKFERDRETGRWVPKAATLEPHVAQPKAAKKRASR